MGQQLFKPDFEYSKEINEISISSFDDRLSSIFPWKIDQISTNSNEKTDLVDLPTNLIEHIRNEIFQLTNSTDFSPIDSMINEISSSLQHSHANSFTKINQIWEKQKQFRITFNNQQENPSTNSSELVHIAIQSLTSILLILIKSVEKTDPTIIHQILSFTVQLIEQIPLKSFSIYSQRFLHSLDPIQHFIEQLSYSTDLFLSHRSIEILFHFSLIKSSFKDLLILFNRFLFDTNHKYNFKNLFLKLNQNLSSTSSDQIDLSCKEYLQLNEIFPEFVEKEFNGQMICSIIIAFIQLDSSFSFQFHPEVFQLLIQIINQLFDDQSNEFLLKISLDLFRKHFQYYFDLNHRFYEKILCKDEQQLNEFLSQEQFDQYFLLFEQISKNHSNEFIREQSANILCLILHFKCQTFEQKQILINQILTENSSEILTQILLNGINDEIQLRHFIQMLFKGNFNHLLNPLIEKYVNENNQIIQQILLSLHNLILAELIELSKKIKENPLMDLANISSFVVEYVKYVLEKCSKENELIRQIFVGLFLMTNQKDLFHFNLIEKIFPSILPVLFEYSQKSLTEYPKLLWILMGKMCEVLVNSFPLNNLESELMKVFASPLFIGGSQSESVDHLLLSLHENGDETRELIHKIRTSLRLTDQSLPKSLEDHVNNSCLSLFAVSLKSHRRLNLLHHQFTLSTDAKLHPQILSLYKSSFTFLQNVFITRKGLNEDLDELTRSIRSKCLFLIESIGENPSIELIKIDEVREKIRLQRQFSHWTKARCVIRLLRNLFKACLRFKRLIQHKIHQSNSQQILNESIQQFLLQTISIEQIQLGIQRQFQRAHLRLSTYQFIRHVVQTTTNESIGNLFQQMKMFNWNILENISIVDQSFKQKIRQEFYSIIQIILNQFQSEEIFIRVCHLLNQSNTIEDIQFMDQYQILQRLFVFSNNRLDNHSLKFQLIAFHWLRMIIIQIAQLVQRNSKKDSLNKQISFVFNEFLLEQLRMIKSMRNNEEDCSIDSLENVSFAWFYHRVEKKEISPSFEHYLNEYLILILQSIKIDSNIRSICSNSSFIEILLQIYSQSRSITTRLLLLNLLGELISSLTNYSEEKMKKLIEKFLNDILSSIGDSLKSTRLLLNPLINTYRLIISRKSPYQILSIQLIFKSLEESNVDEVNASLAVLHGFLPSISLSSIVNVKGNRLGLIVDQSSNYLVEYFDNYEKEIIEISQMEIEDRFSSIDFLLLPNGNEIVQKLFDRLFHLIEINENLSIKRRSIQSLFYLLNNPKFVEIFLENPFLSHIAQLTISSSDQLQSLNRQTLEKFYLKQRENPSVNLLNEHLMEYLSTSGWKSFATKEQIDLLSDGRSGNNHFVISPYPKGNFKENLFEECGIKHRFRGKIVPTSESIDGRFPTFILENIRVYRGNWYFCIRLSSSALVQIGWATDGFSPGGSKGVGDDLYSWSFDGSRDRLFHNREYSTSFPTNRWKKNDVCGCGIEINDQSIQIKYWLNGKYLGRAFSHQQTISSSSTKCNLLPNGTNTSFFPAISLQSYSDPPTICEWIFTPQEMNQCPLPHGFRPILLPKLIHIENTIVPYPFHAFLIGTSQLDFLYTDRFIYPKKFLRDFVHQSHLDIDCTFQDDSLKLNQESQGLPLIINDDLSSLTVSFQFQLETIDSNEIQLLTINHCPIRFSLDNLHEKQTIVLRISFDHQQIDLFTVHQHQTSSISLLKSNSNQIHINILPKLDGLIKNVAIWKYSLSEEEMSRLFLQGLNYIYKDFQQLKEHEQQMNTLTFESHRFINGILLPFDQHFKEDLWEKKKEQFDSNESKYFDSSQIVLYGNKTYLILDKSKQIWFEYSIIFDIFIPEHSSSNTQITLLSINPKIHLLIDEENHLCLLDNDEKHPSKSSIDFNEYFRVFILVKSNSVEIYRNDSLEIHLDVCDDRYAAKTNHWYLFKESDLTKNRMNEQTLRLKCQSITYLSHSIDLNIKSLRNLVYPSMNLIGDSLIAIGYKQSWIQSVIDENHLFNIEEMNSILRKEKDRFIQMDLKQANDNYSQIASRLNLSIDQLNDLVNNWKTTCPISIEFPDESNWFEHIQKSLNLKVNFNEWLEDKSEYSCQTDGILPNSSSNSRRVFNLFDDDDDDDDDDGNSSSNAFEILMNFFGKDSEENSFVQLNDSSTLNYQLTQLNSSDKTMINEDWKEMFSSVSLNEYENALIRIYARSIFDKFFSLWTNQSKNSFPLDKFADYQFLILFLKNMNEHFIAMNSTNINPISLLIKSILQSQNILDENSFFHHLQKEIFMELIRFLTDSDQLNNDSSKLKFVFEVLNIYLEFLKEKQLNISIEDVYPPMLVNLLFDLIFLLKKNQSKIFLLRLFTQLIQIDEHFMLSPNIQRIFFKFLHQLSTENPSKTKYLQIALMDLICVILIKKNQEKVVIQLDQLPQNIRSLLNVVQILNRLNDRTIVQLFLEEIQHIDNEEQNLNEDLFEKSFQFFHEKLDRELIEFINEHLSSEQSFSEFNENLSEKIDSKSFESFTNIPIEFVQTRILFFFQLNQLLVRILPMVDLNFPPGQSYLTDQLRKGKFSLLHQIKLQLLNLSLEKTSLPNQSPTIRLSFHVLQSTENQQTIFQQAFKQLYSIASVHFRRKLRQLWQAVYIGMHSIDQGGPYRDSITQICSDICSSRLSLFLLCPNGRTSCGSNRDCWIPNVYPPNEDISNEIKEQYQFVGQLMGMAIRRKHYLNLKFPNLFWKELLNEKITSEDIQSIDIQSFTIIEQVEKSIRETYSNDINELFSSIFSDLHFEVVSSSGETFELIPNGKSIPITMQNFEQFIHSYRQYRLNEFQRQISFIRQGLSSVIPSYFLNLFTPDELEQLVCGKSTVDIDLLKRNTKYEDCEEDDSHIERFWDVLQNMFNDEQRKLFLTFVWGRNTLPTRDEDFTMKFTINQFDPDDHLVDQILPRSHTCVFSIDLPEYSTKEIMYDKLIYAITNCSSIDGDGTFNEDPNDASERTDTDSDD